jgi:RHS repeat-associated protein
MGTTVFLTNNSGTIVDTYGITPYGQITTSTGATENPFTFIGAYGVMQEGDTGLYYMRARCYDSASGSFISRDPIKSIGPRQISPYQYALQNPLYYEDPRGLQGDIPSDFQVTVLDPADGPLSDDGIGPFKIELQGVNDSPILPGLNDASAQSNRESPIIKPLFLGPGPLDPGPLGSPPFGGGVFESTVPGDVNNDGFPDYDVLGLPDDCIPGGDTLGPGNSQVVTITVVPVNDAPVLDFPGGEGMSPYSPASSEYLGIDLTIRKRWSQGYQVLSHYTYSVDNGRNNGSPGYFHFDTTGYASGVHTIQWTASDPGGDTDGIGSRYFQIQNTGG